MDQSNYFIKERKDNYGVIVKTYTPKKGNCEFCKVKNSTNKMKVLFYRDKDNYSRSKHLCVFCYDILKKLIKKGTE